MSNSIWKTPDQKPDGEDTYIAITNDGLICSFVSPKMCDDTVAKWCYTTDLIAQADKAERLQKAVDLAQERLLSISDGYDIMKADAETIKRLFYAIQDEASETYKEIKQLINGE